MTSYLPEVHVLCFTMSPIAVSSNLAKVIEFASESLEVSLAMESFGELARRVFFVSCTSVAGEPKSPLRFTANLYALGNKETLATYRHAFLLGNGQRLKLALGESLATFTVGSVQCLQKSYASDGKALISAAVKFASRYFGTTSVRTASAIAVYTALFGGVPCADDRLSPRSSASRRCTVVGTSSPTAAFNGEVLQLARLLLPSLPHLVADAGGSSTPTAGSTLLDRGVRRSSCDQVINKEVSLQRRFALPPFLPSTVRLVLLGA